MKYKQIIDTIGNLLNTKNYGRGKKGFNIQDEFLKLLKELKESYKIEVSTTWLFERMNTDLNQKQKRKKIQNLLKGLETRKESRFFRELKILNYEVDIKDFEFKNNYTGTKKHKNRETKPLQIKISKRGTAYQNLKNQKELRDIGIWVCEDKNINFDVRKTMTSGEFLATERENLKFVDLN